MQALEVLLVVALLLIGAVVLIVNGWFQWGWSSLPSIARSLRHQVGAQRAIKHLVALVPALTIRNWDTATRCRRVAGSAGAAFGAIRWAI